HLHHCHVCAGALKRVQQDLRRVADMHARCERNHEQGRERLLDALGGVPAEHRVRPWRKRFPVLKETGAMRRWLIGGAAAVAVVGLLLAWVAARLPSALAQMAEAL